MKRLLCIISCMNTGGAETFLMKIYRALDKEKYQMDFCVNMTENFYAKEIEELGGKMYFIPTKSQSVKEFRKALTKVVKENNYKYVLRIASNGMSFMDVKIAKKAGAEICAVRSSNSSDGEGIKAIIAHRLGRLLYGKYVDVKIAPSDLAAKYTFGKGAYEKGKVSILHNAIDLSVFSYSQEARSRVRTDLGLTQNVPVFGHIGRFAIQKNHMFLLEVFSQICKEISNAKLILVGKGTLENDIKEKANELGVIDNIIFTGVRSDIPQLLSAMDVFIFPSFYEGMPNTVIEAQATGLPCIISDAITREANITGIVDYLPLNGDADIWARYAIEALKTPRKYTRESFLTNGYDIENATKQFVNMIFNG